MEPVGIFLTLFALATFATALVIISRLRRGDSSRFVDPAMVRDTVRVDLGVARSLPQFAAVVEGVKWTKLVKHYGGRTVVGGVAVFGPQRLTWAPDDAARRLGVQPWQMAWADMAGVAVRTATDTSSAALLVTFDDSTTVELVGVNESAALAAVNRRTEPT